MIQAKCIQKFRDKNNHIYGYRLQDINGKTQDVRPDNLKQAIANKQIHVVNLTLTSDNRLVDTTEHHLQSKSLGSIPQPPKSEVIKQRMIDIAEYIQNNKASYLRIDYYDFFEDSDGDYAFSISDAFDITVNRHELFGEIGVYIKKNEISFNLMIKDENGAIITESEYKTVKLDIFKKTNNEINSIVAKYQDHIQNIYHCFELVSDKYHDDFVKFIKITGWKTSSDDLSDEDAIYSYFKCKTPYSSELVDVYVGDIIELVLYDSNTEPELNVHVKVEKESANNIKVAAKYIEKCQKLSKVPIKEAVVQNGKIIKDNKKDTATNTNSNNIATMDEFFNFS